MSDSPNPTFDARYAPREESMTAPLLVYGAYLLSVPSAGLFALVGVILAYILKGDAGPAAYSHYVFQIRTFWLSLLFIPLGVLLVILGIPLMLVVIGFPIILLGGAMVCGVTVWFVVRCVVGIIKAIDGQPYGNPRTWLV